MTPAVAGVAIDGEGLLHRLLVGLVLEAGSVVGAVVLVAVGMGVIWRRVGR